MRATLATQHENTHDPNIAFSRAVMGGGKGRVLSASSQSGITLRDWRVTIEDGRTLDGLISTRGCDRIVRERMRVD
ncbi:hypothetical protein H8D79_00750 [PVC group bacterium]|nr:hypothetical protein [PVC group bacterium]